MPPGKGRSSVGGARVRLSGKEEAQFVELKPVTWVTRVVTQFLELEPLVLFRGVYTAESAL